MLYGHGVQLPDLLPEGAVVAPALTSSSRPDPISFSDDRPLVPWSFDGVASGDLEYRYWFGSSSPPDRWTNGTQPDARDWTLARQAILLADDGGLQTQFHKTLDTVPAAQTTYGQNSAVSLFVQDNLETLPSDWDLFPNFAVRSSRVDVAASTLDDIQRILAPQGSTTWRTRMINGFFGPFFGPEGQLFGYVRSEKVSPSMNRQDVMLTTPTLATNCSSFMVDWTWGPSVDGYELLVFPLPPPAPQMPQRPTLWFGYPDSQFPLPPLPGSDERRGVRTLTEAPSLIVPPISAAVIEGVLGTPIPLLCPLGPTGPIKIYTAVFGFNKDKPYFKTLGAPPQQPPQVRPDYTPWPTALRITMQLHDPEKRIEQGRTVQMIIELPRHPTSQED